MSILGIIPARYASTRFPGKPLADINGRSMILRVYDQALKSGVFSEVLVATDDERIAGHVRREGYNAVMTSPTHRSGTERCLEALGTWEKESPSHYDFMINIQGDEPYIHPGQIQKAARLLTSEGARIATLASIMKSREEIFNPNVVKVVFDNRMNALYFSRAPIPFIREVDEIQWNQLHVHYKHIGIYGFETSTLRQVCSLPEGALEKIESLEQLRWLEAEINIKIDLTEFESVAIDTPEDLLKITNMA